MNKTILSLFMVFVVAFTTNDVSAQGHDEIAWKSFEEVDQLMKTNPKPVIIDMYTSWCGWCKVMDKKTYTNTHLIEYLNEHFYAIKFNAEQKEPVSFMGKTFESKGKTHQIAIELMQGRLSYPTTIIMEKDMKSISPIPGYLKPGQMETIMKYIVSGREDGISWVDWQKEFKPSWKEMK